MEPRGHRVRAVRQGTGLDTLGIGSAIAVYAVSTILGALTLMPGGIGLTEASMTGLLIAAAWEQPMRRLVRCSSGFVTLWFGVGLGWAVLATRPSILRGAARADLSGSA